MTAIRRLTFVVMLLIVLPFLICSCDTIDTILGIVTKPLYYQSLFSNISDTLGIEISTQNAELIEDKDTHDDFLNDGEGYYVFRVDKALRESMSEQLAGLSGWRKTDGSFAMPESITGIVFENVVPSDVESGWQFYLDLTTDPKEEPDPNAPSSNCIIAFFDLDEMLLYVFEYDS